MSRSVRSGGKSAVRCYLSEIHAIPRLTRDQEIALGAQAAAGHRQSLDDLVLANLNFVVQIATEYLNMGLPLDDLLNEGNIGLMCAATRYDHRKGLKFITYAAWWVRKMILQALEDHGSTVRVPPYQREKLAREAALEDGPSGRPARTVASFHARVISIEELAPGAGGTPLADRLPDTRTPDPEHELLRTEGLTHLRRGLSILSEKERTVIIWRFGLSDEGVLTLQEIGERMGLSRERIRQIEQSARHKLRARCAPAWTPQTVRYAPDHSRRLQAATGHP